MNSELLFIIAVSVVFSVTAHPVSTRMAPRTAAIVYTASAVLIALTSTGLLAVEGWYAAARFTPIAHQGGWSSRLLERTSPLPFPTSVLAGTLALAIVVSIVRLWTKRARELRTEQRAHRPIGSTGSGEIAVIITDDIDAYAIDGTLATRRIVLTDALLRELPDPALQRAVIEHERSHLRHHHLIYRLCVESAVRANPLLRPATHVVEHSLEAWADDDAATITAPATVATALATIALTKTRPLHRRVALAIANSATVRRIERLLTPIRPNRIGALVATTMTLSARLALALCCHQTERFFEALRTASNA